MKRLVKKYSVDGTNLINEKPFLDLVLEYRLFTDLVELKFIEEHVFRHLERPFQSPAALIVVQYSLYTRPRRDVTRSMQIMSISFQLSNNNKWRWWL